MSRMPPLTMDEHRELGAVLASMRDELAKTVTRISGHLPKSHPAVQRLLAAVAQIDKARIALEGRMFADHNDGGPEGADISVYYPVRDARRQVTP